MYYFNTDGILYLSGFFTRERSSKGLLFTLLFLLFLLFLFLLLG
jgi:hypothetical protein